MKPTQQFFHSPTPTPGVPVSKFVTPLVRVNGQEQEMGRGMKIDPAFIGSVSEPVVPLAAQLAKIHWVTQDNSIAEEGMIVEVVSPSAVTPLHFKIVPNPVATDVLSYEMVLNKVHSFSGGEWSIDISSAEILNSVAFGPLEWLVALSMPQDVNEEYVGIAGVTVYLLVNGKRAGYIRVSPSYVFINGTGQIIYDFHPFVPLFV
jgi:hypothetical protein